ncbi:MAG: hypothetical protein BM556_08440 [Bacteriovorax sp. MedPE-SWde]|nr:MAG: hypothetical protein BM556_08440 [Bacteriovorax sp. MedPE-SWde]
MRNLLIVIITFVSFVSCTKNKGPESVLKSYIENRFSQKIEKSDFTDFFGGELLEEMNTLDNEAIGKLNQVKGQKKKSFKINFRRCDNEKCFLTYTLVFDTTAKAEVNSSGTNEADVRVKVKKIAELRKVEEKWKIFGISDIKTHYDYKTLNK